MIIRRLVENCRIKKDGSNIYRLSSRHGVSTLEFGNITLTSDEIPEEFQKTCDNNQVVQVFWTKAKFNNRNGPNPNTLIVDRVTIQLLRSNLKVGDVLDLYEPLLKFLCKEFSDCEVVIPDSGTYKRDYKSLPDLDLHKLIPRKYKFEPLKISGRLYYKVRL